MKKFVILLFVICFGVQFADAQNDKIFVSKQGGTKKLITLGKRGYNNYYFSSTSDQCDTLRCSGSGYEICRIDKNIMNMNEAEKATYKVFNKAIRATEKAIRKTQNRAGELFLEVNNYNLHISYSNADDRGNAEMEISVL